MDLQQSKKGFPCHQVKSYIYGLFIHCPYLPQTEKGCQFQRSKQWCILNKFHTLMYQTLMQKIKPIQMGQGFIQVKVPKFMFIANLATSGIIHVQIHILNQYGNMKNIKSTQHLLSNEHPVKTLGCDLHKVQNMLNELQLIFVAIPLASTEQKT